MRIPRAFSFIALLAASLAGAQTVSPQPFGEQAFVTAIELMVRVTDARGATPSDLELEDFTVLEDCVERRVIGVEYLAPPPAGALGDSAQQATPRPWEVVVWVDGTTTSQRSLLTLTRDLATRSAELISLGPVTIVWSNPNPEIVLTESVDPERVAETFRGLSRRSASDQIARIRAGILGDSDRGPMSRGGIQMGNFGRAALSAAREESRAIRAARLAALEWLSRMPRRPQRALFLVGDGFDLDPAEFYLDLIASSGNPEFARMAPALRELSQADEHEELVRALAVEGWTVIGVGGTGTTYFPDDASRSGENRVRSYLGSNPGSRPPGLLQSHPREPLLQAAEATGGSVIPHAGKLDEAVDDLQSRIRLTYQVPRAPDAEARKVDVSVNREGLTVAAPKWASSTTPASLAKGRAIRLLRPKPEIGDFAVDVSLALGKADRSSERKGTVSARANLESIAKAATLSTTAIRITVAVGGGDELPAVVQETFPAVDLATEAIVDWSAAIAVSPDQKRVSVVFEELSTGAWGGGGASLDEDLARKETSALELAEALLAASALSWTFDRDDALARARSEGKPVFAMVVSARCKACIAVARHSFSHPAVRRGLADFIPLLIEMVEPPRGRARKDHSPAEAIPSAGSLQILDPEGRTHHEMPLTIVAPEGTQLIGTEDVTDLLARFGRVAPLLVEGAELQKAGDQLGAESAFAMAYRRAGTTKEAREAFETVLELARQKGDRRAEQSAAVMLGLVELQDGDIAAAIGRFRAVETAPESPLNEAEALLGVGQALRAEGDEAGAGEAFVRAARLAPEGSEARAAALALAGASQDVIHGAIALTPSAAIKPLQLIVGGRPPFSGTVDVQALVRLPEIDRVAFTLDGTLSTEDPTPPFQARIDLGEIPRPRELRASGYDPSGALVAEDVIHVNERHDEFGIDLVTEPLATGLEARLDLTVPLGRQVTSVDLTLDGRGLETLTAPPWRVIIDRVVTETSVLRAVATLDDGTAEEDAVLLDPQGVAEEIEVHDVQIFASVVDRQGEPVRDLEAEDFALFEDRRRKPIHGFEFLEGGSWTAGLAIDSSGSMTEEMPDVREAARSFLRNTVERGGHAFIVDFDGAPRLASPTTSDLPSLERALDEITAGGSTSLYDAIVFGLLQLQEADGKRALIVLSDGNDLRSRYGPEQTIRVAQESGATVYVIVMDEAGWIFDSELPPDQSRFWITRGQPLGRVDRIHMELERLAKETGGRAWYVRSPEGLVEIYEQIDQELRNQYLLTYRTAPVAREDEWRPIRVDVKRRGLTARTIAGFFAR